MNLIAKAVPFFLLAIVIELVINQINGRGLYRVNDTINNVSLGTISTTLGYFTRMVPVFFWWYTLQNFALLDLPYEWFDASARGILLWLSAAVLWDFCYYWFHRCAHEVSLFWAAHAVHHQSEDYNLSTALRQTGTDFLFGWIFYLPLYLIGYPLRVLVAVGAVNLIYQFFAHTQLVGKLGPLDRIVVTPSNHRVHHAQNEQYIDKNYGGIFIIWDRLFGTFAEEDERDPVIFGIRKPLSSWNPLWANVHLYQQLLNDAIHTKRWRDKIGLWFRRTGWRPADVEERFPLQKSDLTQFKKYDPPVPSKIRAYIAAQFSVAFVVALAIAELFAQQGTEGILIPCVALWAMLYSIGFFLDGHKHAFYVELARLTIGNGLLVTWYANSAALTGPLFWELAGLYSAASILWLTMLRNVEQRVDRNEAGAADC